MPVALTDAMIHRSEMTEFLASLNAAKSTTASIRVAKLLTPAGRHDPNDWSLPPWAARCTALSLVSSIRNVTVARAEWVLVSAKVSPTAKLSELDRGQRQRLVYCLKTVTDRIPLPPV